MKLVGPMQCVIMAKSNESGVPYTRTTCDTNAYEAEEVRRHIEESAREQLRREFDAVPERVLWTDLGQPNLLEQTVSDRKIQPCEGPVIGHQPMVNGLCALCSEWVVKS